MSSPRSSKSDRTLDYRALAKELATAASLCLFAVPQGIAYAMIAGLPPVTGLYAGSIATIVGGLTRSSRHTVVGPTNAVSLLVGSTIALQQGLDPLTVAVTLAALVGVIQLATGLLKLGAIVDYISTAVVVGYITGAGVLIGVGQLGNASGLPGGTGHLVPRIIQWLTRLPDAHLPSLALTLGTMIAIVVIRVFLPTHPATLWAMLGGIGLSTFADLKRGGMLLVHDLAPVTPGLPPLSLPQLDLVETLFPAALATALLSSVEATAISRNIASRTGQRLDTARDFVGLGLANLTAGLTSGYPVSGSLSRSALNERAGTTTRLGGTASGLWMLMVLIAFGPIVDLTPVPSLAGILLVTAADLIDTRRIREILASSQGDRLAFLVTVIGTWTLSLERAILLGAGISIALFLRRARHLLVRELEVDALDRLRVRNEEEPFQGSTSIRVLHIEGNLFFGAASELQRTLDSATRDRDVRVLILRLRRTQAMDVTTAYVLLAAARAMQRHDRHLLLVGIRPRPMEMLVRTGIAASWGEKHLFPSQAEWFGAMDSALAQAVDLANTDAACPFRRYLRTRESQSPL